MRKGLVKSFVLEKIASVAAYQIFEGFSLETLLYKN